VLATSCLLEVKAQASREPAFTSLGKSTTWFSAWWPKTIWGEESDLGGFVR
jgi:hypothetical protein